MLTLYSSATTKPKSTPATIPTVAIVNSTTRAAAVTANRLIASCAATIRLMPGSKAMIPPTTTRDAVTSTSDAVSATATRVANRAKVTLVKNVGHPRRDIRSPKSPLTDAVANATAAVRASPPRPTVIAADSAPEAGTVIHC